MEYALVALWLLVYAGLAVLGYPIAARLLHRLPTRGAGFALPVAVVTIWLPVYWIGRVSFGPASVSLGALVLVGLAAWFGLDREALRSGELRPAADLDADRGVVADTAVVFALAFGFLVAVRAVDPAVHAIGGEKYLDFGLLSSLMLSGQLPPEDMWFAGEPVNYYYGGHLAAAILTILTGTLPKFAYNLAHAGFYAMLVAAAFDLAGAVAAARASGAGSADAAVTAARRRAGAFAAFFAGIASNLETVGKFLVGFLPPDMREAAVHEGERIGYYALDPSSPNHFEATFSYWSASRVIPGTINEFPLFAWLNGDMHAHMMGTPFLLLAAAVGFALYLTPAGARRERLALLGTLPLLGLFQLVTDTWSFPSVFGVAFLALWLAPADPTALLPRAWADRLREVGPDTRAVEELRRPLVAGAVLLAPIVLAVLLGIPFLTGAGASRSIDLLGPQNRSSLGELVVVHGAFVALFLVFLLARLGSDGRWPLVAGLVALGWVAVAQGMAVVAVAAPLFVLGWATLRFGRSAAGGTGGGPTDETSFETVLVLAGAGLVTIVEFVYVVEQAGPLRMNTVFKTYMQVWVLWAVAAGIVADAVIRSPPSVPRLSPAQARTVASVFVALLVLSTSVYGALALASHFRPGDPATLDATSFDNYNEGELRAVEWLEAREKPGLTIISAPAAGWYPAKESYGHPPGMYSWNSAIAASLTGVPTVAGWGHEVGYRGKEAFHHRVARVDAAYTGSDAETVAVLRDYDVEYIWVGTAERARYGSELKDLDSIPGVSVAYETSAVTIYRVDEEELPEG